MSRKRACVRLVVGCLALLLPITGCSAEEEGAKGVFSSNMSAAIKLSRCTGADIHLVLLSLNTVDPQASETVDDRLKCVGSAQSCDDVFTCEGFTGAACNPFEPTDSCDGAQLTSCAADYAFGWVRETDCAADPHGNTICDTMNPCEGMSEEEQEHCPSYG